MGGEQEQQLDGLTQKMGEMLLRHFRKTRSRDTPLDKFGLERLGGGIWINQRG